MDNSELMNAILAKVFHTFVAQTDSGQRKLFVSYPFLGIPVDAKDLNFGQGSTSDELAAASRFAQLSNAIPPTDGPWQPGLGVVWDAYSEALTYADFPTGSGSASSVAAGSVDAQASENAKQTSAGLVAEPAAAADREPSDHELEARHRLQSAQHQLNYAKIDPATGDDQVEALAKKVRRLSLPAGASATGAAGLRAQKPETDSAPAAGSLSPGIELAFQRQLGVLKVSQRLDPQGASYYPTGLFPSDPLDPRYDDSWTRFQLAADQSPSIPTDDHALWGGLVSSGFGLFGFSDSATESDRDLERIPAATDGATVAVELMALSLLRSWMNPLLLQSRAWRFDPTSGFAQLSDGQLPANGLMPAYAAQAVIARRLTLQLDQEANQHALERVEKSTVATWGPFTLRSGSAQPTVSNGKLVVGGAQLIAFVCNLLAKTPDPDPSLAW